MKKILFIRLSSLGDIVLTESCIRIAKNLYPDFEIHYLTKPVFADLVKSFNVVDKVLLWNDKINLIKDLRKEKYDYVIDLHSKLNTFIIKCMIFAHKTITWEKQHFLRQLMVNKLSTQQIDTVVWNYLKTLERIEMNDFTIESVRENNLYYPRLISINNVLNSVKDVFTTYNIPTNHYLIGVFPGAQHLTKQYPVEKLVNFISDVPDHWKCSFLILGDWKEKKLALKMKSLSVNKLYDLTGAFNIIQLISAVSLLDAVISNDSGPMHIAAALKKPQIAIYGATHTRLGFRPLNDKAIILQKNLSCQPCSLHGGKTCPKRTLECFRQIHSSELFESFQYLFEKYVLDV